VTGEGLSRHLKAKGISKVLLTAPGKGDIPNIVFGVNEKSVDYNKKPFYLQLLAQQMLLLPYYQFLRKNLELNKDILRRFIRTQTIRIY